MHQTSNRWCGTRRFFVRFPLLLCVLLRGECVSLAQLPPPKPDEGSDPPPIGPPVGPPGGSEDCVLPPGVSFIQMTTRSNPDGAELADVPDVELKPRLFTIQTPSGRTLPISIRPAGPNISSQPAPVPDPPAFRPPSIFSAPLPAGSGARALGVAGAFSAVADDATAASWNPAALIQLERPEVSMVYRHSATKNDHTSTDPGFLVDGDDYESDGVNYLSGTFPFFLQGIGRNAVFSLNYQEAYDFTHSFSAQINERADERIRASNERTFSETQVDRLKFPQAGGHSIQVEIISKIVTRSSSTLDQEIVTEIDSDLSFDQEGVIEAATPAFAIEISPTFSIGGAFNYYQDSAFSSRKIRSRTLATYESTSKSAARITRDRITSGSFTSRSLNVAPDGFELVFEEETGTYPGFSDSSSSVDRDEVLVRGTYDEENAFDDLHGFNANFGFFWTASRYLTFGGSVDLPWTADSEQRNTIRTKVETFDRTGTRLLRSDASIQAEKKEVELEFPLFWTIGASLRVPGSLWPRLRTNLDVGQTLWSDFAFRAEGEGKINPLDGSPHGENPIDDTWFIRTGVEYLWVLEHSEIPFRAGFVWEQRPAIGEPDDYIGFSIGSGISLGKDPGKLIIDVAYSYLAADDVQSVVPNQEGLSTDTEQHQLFISGIYHF